MILPAKKSFHWIYVLMGVFAINILALLISRIMLTITINLQNIIGFTILALLVSVIGSIGYFGIRKFSYVFIIFDILGLFYMYFIILSNNSDGWVDLTSLIGFIVLIDVGIAIGIIAEFIYWIVKRNFSHPRNDRYVKKN